MATKKKTEKDELTKVDITHADVNDGGVFVAGDYQEE